MNRAPVEILRDPATIRERAHRLLDLCLQGELDHFAADIGKLDAVADFVVEVMRERYPHLDIPYHARWRHFAAGGVDRWTMLQNEMNDRNSMARSAIDLTVVSVLLDAGAGAQWRYREQQTGLVLSRSEGLAVASFHMFRNGFFSSDPEHPWQVDAEGLARLDEEKLRRGFQATESNAMTGLEGRVTLVKSLAGALRSGPEFFGGNPARPGYLLDFLSRNSDDIDARYLLAALLAGFTSIWPGRIALDGNNLGDVWPHGKLVYADATNHLMPFHKLTQWLAYSLLEPLAWAGKRVTSLDTLTGLAEYRNGGLFIDSGLLYFKDPAHARKHYHPADEAIVEWRALTVALLDRLRVPVAQRLGVRPGDFPLVRLLEGGTWAAGRKIAAQKRPATAEPPISIVSDGTIF